MYVCTINRVEIGVESRVETGVKGKGFDNSSGTREVPFGRFRYPISVTKVNRRNVRGSTVRLLIERGEVFFGKSISSSFRRYNDLDF